MIISRHTAADRIYRHILRFRHKLGRNPKAQLTTYRTAKGKNQYCPLCLAIDGRCYECVEWPLEVEKGPTACIHFIEKFNKRRSPRIKEAILKEFMAKVRKWEME